MPHVCAVVVAAGLSSRMHTFKPLLPIKNKPAIVHLSDVLLSAGVSRVIVVTGFRHTELEVSCSEIEQIQFVHNPDYASTQMFDSAKIGFASVPPEYDRILFMPADIPLVSSHTIISLLEQDAPLLFPSYHYHRGHPMALDAWLLPYITQYIGTGGLRGAIAALPVEPAYLVVEDPFVLMDMDTPSDYLTLLQHYDQMGGVNGELSSQYVEFP